MGFRSVELGRGRTLVVRAPTRDDIDGLIALYARLDLSDRYRRFFSVYYPDAKFFDRLIDAPAKGGDELIVTVSEAGQPDRIVGEGGYFLLPNGNAEVALTIECRWRGWLGHYLLDALMERGAARGIPNFEADILVTNGPMLALFRRRGMTIMSPEGMGVIRVVISTQTGAPTRDRKYSMQPSSVATSG